MSLETATYINGLNSANPTASDPISAGDDHLRLLKSTIKATFPNITGAVTATHTELSFVDGVTSAIQTQLNAKAASSHTHAETEIADGGIFPRLGSTEVIPGSWNFTTRPTVNGNGVLDTASSIPETQIADGAVFPRLAANETITGNWSFSGTVNAGGMNIAGSAVWHAGNLTPSNYSLTSHLHTGVYAASAHTHTGVYSDISHTHDTRYYTESEVDALIAAQVGSSGSFTGYLRYANNGPDLASATIYWKKVNGVVTLTIPELSTTNTTGTLVLDGIPAALQATSISGYILAYGWNAGTQEPILLYPVIGGDYFNLYRTSGAGFTTTATTKGLRPSHITYQVL